MPSVFQRAHEARPEPGRGAVPASDASNATADTVPPPAAERRHAAPPPLNAGFTPQGAGTGSARDLVPDSEKTVPPAGALGDSDAPSMSDIPGVRSRRGVRPLWLAAIAAGVLGLGGVAFVARSSFLGEAKVVNAAHATEAPAALTAAPAAVEATTPPQPANEAVPDAEPAKAEKAPEPKAEDVSAGAPEAALEEAPAEEAPAEEAPAQQIPAEEAPAEEAEPEKPLQPNEPEPGPQAAANAEPAKQVPAAAIEIPASELRGLPQSVSTEPLPGSDPIPVGLNPDGVQYLTSRALRRSFGCHPNGRTNGTVSVFTTFGTDGRVTDVRIAGEPMASAPVTECIKLYARSAVIPKFDGEPFTLRHEVTLR
jgi:hypothetical protein